MIELSDFYPEPEDLVASEVQILGHVRNSPYIKQWHPEFARDAQQYYERNRSTASGFEFNSYFDILQGHVGRNNTGRSRRSQNPNIRLTISARVWLIKHVYSNVTYCLSVCRLRGRRLSILRKYHFDIAVASGGRSQEHPRCHLQYCGEMVPYMKEIGCREEQLEQLHPWLSEPRIFFWPMALGLLIDLALHEFPDQGSEKFRQDSHWRNLIRGQEVLLLQPFFKKCLDVISDRAAKNRTLADVFYVR